METFNPIARDFILFCIQRRGKNWPELYDEMCWVASHRLFKGMGYAELRRFGLSLGLNNIERITGMVDTITAQEGLRQ